MKIGYLMLVVSWVMILLCINSVVCESVISQIGTHNYSIKCVHKERDALLVFKQGLQFDHCGMLTSWDDRQLDCCQWYGITCDHLTGHVIGLDLSGRFFYPIHHGCLGGKISASLLELKHLKFLDLSVNDFTDQPVPSLVASLANLEHLDLSYNSFTRKIPRQLANISSLSFLDLSFNDFYGEIPHELGNLSSLTDLHLGAYDERRHLFVKNIGWLSRLRMLRGFSLNYVDLNAATDWMQSIQSIEFLRFFQLRSCGLWHPLVNMNISSSLRHLDLGLNHFNDPSVFHLVFNLTRIGARIEYLDLSVNNFQSPIPQEISILKHLEYLDLSKNNFQGNVPKRLGNLCSLRKLYLEDNSLDEELSSIIHSLSGCAQNSLLTLNLTSNKVWGSIPDTIAPFSSLRELSLGHNKLNDTISQNVGQLSMLQELSLDSNSLKGTLSEHHFSNLSRLTRLMLSNNVELVVNISANWTPPFQPKIVDMGSCKLGPHFPNWLLNQNSVDYLDISNTGISDTLPLSFWNILPSFFTYLNVSKNNISGALPPNSLSIYSRLIDFSYNNIEGVIPLLLERVEVVLLNNNRFTDSTTLLCPKAKVEISYLDLSNNLLSGKLQDCWNHVDFSVFFLHLENNNFTGKLPTSIGGLKNITALYLQKNSFVGELPRSIENCRSLALLDVSFNSLNENLPPEIGRLKNLSILNLRSNQLSGDIPLSLCQLSRLQILDLSINHFSGVIPNCIHNLTGMINATNMLPANMYRDIRFHYHNYVTFHIWNDSAEVMWKRKERTFRNALGMVKYIAISDNLMQGQIPRGISSLRGLDSLDMARNNLTGTIPSDIGQLSSLELFDLSNNHLSGEIPTSLANMTYLGTLNLSYNDLTGRIPPGTQLQGFDPAVYMGNHGLCGPPLSRCPVPPNNFPKRGAITKEANENGDIHLGFYISAVLGFIVGFWGVCGSLVLKRTWRNTYFRVLGEIKDRLHVMIVVNIAKVWRKA